MSTARQRRWMLAGLVVLSVLVISASFQTGDIFLRLLLIMPTAILWIVYREASRGRRDAQRSREAEDERLNRR
ncbi:MAG: hypothetical protein ACTIA6_16125 [Pseudoclavibacter sp.]